MPPSAWNGSLAGRSMSTSALSSALFHTSSSPWSSGLPIQASIESAPAVSVSAWIRPSREQRVGDERHPAGVLEVVHVLRRRWDRRARSAARRPTSSSKSCQSMRIPAARAIAGKWMTWLVEPPVASRPIIALTIAFSSTTSASGRSPLPRKLGEPVHRRAGQRLAQRRAGIDEGGVGDVQPHQLHHHLVGVGGAVEGAGARRVIGRRSRPSSSSSLPTLPSA